jgi:hypothetical protein
MRNEHVPGNLDGTQLRLWDEPYHNSLLDIEAAARSAFYWMETERQRLFSGPRSLRSDIDRHLATILESCK